MKILITGASGRVGRALIKKLSTDFELIKLSRAEFNDPVASEELVFKNKPDVIIHLASLLHEECELNPELAEDINVTKTKELAAMAAKSGVSKFIFASTAAVYLQRDLSPTDESSNVHPVSVYAKTKRQAEIGLSQIATESNTSFLVLRIFNIYGPDFDDSLVNKLIKSSEANPSTVLGPKNYYRDYIHVSDVAEAFVSGVKYQSEQNFSVLNIGSGKVMSNSELIDEITKKGYRTFYHIKRIDTPNISWADISQSKKILGFNPHTELDLLGIDQRPKSS